MIPRDPQHAPNQLAGSASPYLLQHAHNPVDWRPWGPEAFAEARARDLPIFLSIGYSTCYWCHVMARESFEDADIARQLNRDFVSVKLDREQSPEIDELYMAATVTMTGHGGWPMSVFLEPGTLRPFWCGTYFPPKDSPHAPGRPTFPGVLAAISHAWTNRREEVLEQARTLSDAVAQQLSAAGQPRPLSPETVGTGVSTLLTICDRTLGGFARAPKFPQPVFLEFLLDARGVLDHDTRLAVDQAVRLTLDRMAVGGLRDHLAGGFHRYCVDAAWTVPHFEKMLYDNAQLLSVYARAARDYADEFYRDVALETARFICRDLDLRTGLLASAIDAEADSREGLSYLWTRDEASGALAESGNAPLALRAWGLDQPPNFQDPHHPGDPPRHVLRLGDRPETLAKAWGVDAGELSSQLVRARAALLSVRARRPQPQVDTKAITSWNAMAIWALARASLALDQPELAREARARLDALLAMAGDAPPRRSTFEGLAGPPGVLEDSAWLAAAILAVHRAIPDPTLPRRAATLLESATQAFTLPDGTAFDAPADRDDLFVRPRTTHDGATPSAMSVLAHAWLDLEEAAPVGVSGGAHAQRAALILRAASASIAESPAGSINSTRALLRVLTRHPPLAESLAQGEPAPRPEPDAPPPVEIFSEVERVVVSRESPAAFTLRFRVAPGYHIVAADPASDLSLTPLRVSTVGGSGVEAYADYPPGRPLSQAGHRVAVLEGEFDLPVVLEARGEWIGRPILVVTLQACTDWACSPPSVLELDVAIDRA